MNIKKSSLVALLSCCLAATSINAQQSDSKEESPRDHALRVAKEFNAKAAIEHPEFSPEKFDIDVKDDGKYWEVNFTLRDKDILGGGHSLYVDKASYKVIKGVLYQ